MNFLFRVDANEKIGTGHLMRCLALGQMLQDKGNNIYFATKAKNSNLLGRIKKEKFNIISIDDKSGLLDDAKKTAEAGKNILAKWIIADGYGFSTEYQKVIKDESFKLMTIDDIAKYHFVSDIVLNQNLNAEKIFKYSCETYTKLLLGLRYAMFRREYREIKSYSRIINSNCCNILVTFGGSDTGKYLIKIIESLNLISSISYNIRILTGSDNSKYDMLEDFINKSKHKIVLIDFQENIIPYIQWCDIAISAAGSTVWELAVLKTPAVIIPIADNQLHVAEELRKREAAIVLKTNDDISVCSEKIKDFSLNLEKRKNLSNNISALIEKEDNLVTDYLC